MRSNIDELDEAAIALCETSLDQLMTRSERLTLEGFGPVVTYSRKVFIPLTKLCRDVCHYCTFAETPSRSSAPYLSIAEAIDIAAAGASAGCREALFTLGDRPEMRYSAASDYLAEQGYQSTLEYLEAAASEVLNNTGLLPHLNAGVMTEEDYLRLRPVTASMGLMLETASDRLSERGGPHFGSPDKYPQVRLDSIEAAGRARIPFTTGILIGIGETRKERVEALFAIRDIHRRHGHIQEVIIQNFRAKPGTRMSNHPEPALEDHLWTIAVARLILGPKMTIQAPPNLHRPEDLAQLLRAGVNDWGGVSPLTPDHVNPEAPWPHLDLLERETSAASRILRQRLAIGPLHAGAPDKWLAPDMARIVRRSVDARGLPLTDNWRAGGVTPMTAAASWIRPTAASAIMPLLAKAERGELVDAQEIARLFAADGPEFDDVIEAADAVREEVVGNTVTYVVNRNINYTNICLYKCGFCAFSKGSTRELRGPAYRLDYEEVGRRAAEAAERGATEVCLQGGIHPDYDGNTYLEVLRAVRQAAPSIHIHAFSPLEISHGAATLGLSLATYLGRLKNAGLSTLPGTAAEILHDDVRALICPDKLSAREWLDVMRTAHAVGLQSTATIMFGHVDGYDHWAHHLLAIRHLQEESGGFTEFVPLPFVHMEAPIWRKGRARSGPSAREALLMHAVARLALNPFVKNIQASWVKLGRDGAVQALRSGANDLGGILMDESITRAAGGVNGQLCDPVAMRDIARAAGRDLVRRTTKYERVAERAEAVAS
ncbi:5-amino-6-(D-ribitylamino)uracil--L-tyrosine 4-hydroxyphenyl transferase CofH [Sphingopyxis sp. MG]|uniref:5-amino-6-(D-ribitylamino)uracil--L-tyrosine 4-hydroxyphenyl transferase CofH n=1 Tax=Sphingopyxis sp. MG TaxID=1866325 RepID=UPI000CDF4074|nr:5-amino-6-(D-ribitylamino)uracil--L-tyrosine 4-hydroxyphenyl transferase CofH [Sphingopyxis sp. MG]AVA14657.1 7,8-didemethyl-8-hydroxy-5-deazariboflavin synthase [Sphingopyxis sp. MG]